MSSLLLALLLGAGEEPDLIAVVKDRDQTIRIGLVINLANGSLKQRQHALLKDYRTSHDGSDLLSGLIPDGQLLRTHIVSPSPHVEPLTRAIFEALDTDKDAKLSTAELKKAPEVLLKKFDADGDGCLTPLEIVPDLLTREPKLAAKPAQIELIRPAGNNNGVDDIVKVSLGRSSKLNVDGFHVEVIGDSTRPLSSPVVPKSLLRKGKESERDLYERVAKEVITLTARPQARGWFDQLDANGDGQLSLRELRRAGEHLKDGSATDSVTLPNFQDPRNITIVASSGVATRPAVRLTKVPPPQSGPEWFLASDHNGDGDLSRNEFLGTDEQFRFYDTDQDGLISVAEAIAGDRKLKQGK